MARWVVCGTIVPPMIDLGRANEITDRSTVSDVIEVVRNMLENGKHVLVRRSEDKPVSADD